LGWAVVLFFVFGLAIAAVQIWPELVIKPEGPLRAPGARVLCVAGDGLYAGLVRLAEGRWPSELALRPAIVELLIGLLVGAVMLSVVVALLVGLGLYDVAGPRASSPWEMITVGISSGFMEELVLRAIVLRLLMRAFGAWPALVLSAALFGVLHLTNPNASPVAAFAIAIEAGLMLAAFYMLTGRIWMSVGVHAAWNFAQGWIWGARVPGIEVKERLYVSTPKAGAPEWLSGGAFGPWAAVPAVVAGPGLALGGWSGGGKKGIFTPRPDAASSVAETFD